METDWCTPSDRQPCRVPPLDTAFFLLPRFPQCASSPASADFGCQNPSCAFYSKPWFAQAWRWRASTYTVLTGQDTSNPVTIKYLSTIMGGLWTSYGLSDSLTIPRCDIRESLIPWIGLMGHGDSQRTVDGMNHANRIFEAIRPPKIVMFSVGHIIP